MSTAEVIRLIEQLSENEQMQVREFLEKKLGNAGSGEVRRMDLTTATTMGEGVFERHPELFRRLAQ